MQANEDDREVNVTWRKSRSRHGKSAASCTLLCLLFLLLSVDSLGLQEKYITKQQIHMEELEESTYLREPIKGNSPRKPNGLQLASLKQNQLQEKEMILSTNIIPRAERGLESRSGNIAPATTGSTRSLKSQSSEFPHRVRIAAFNLLLAPTPTKLQRADEDLLLVALQKLTLSTIRKQFGNDGISTNRAGVDTTVDYVLFSDIEGNSWSEGGESPNDPPRTVLEFNGGVASFIGPDIPTEDEVNEYIESAINGLFVSSLTETPYSYVKLTQYMVLTSSNVALEPEDIVVNVPSTEAPKPIQQASIQSIPDAQPASGTTVFNLLVSLLVVIAVTVVVLALWIRYNNRAVRILCLSGKDSEEVVDFTDDTPISISHENEMHQEKTRNFISQNVEVSEVIDELESGDTHNQISLAPQGSVEEASSQTSASEMTLPTVSALSFQNPNPFTKSLGSRESFQKEREMYLSKDMLYSTWAGRAPSVTTKGKRHDHSVLQTSYFSAKKEREALSDSIAAASPADRTMTRNERHEIQDNIFQFESANEDVGNDDQTDVLYAVSPRPDPPSSTPVEQRSKRVSYNFV